MRAEPSRGNPCTGPRPGGYRSRIMQVMLQVLTRINPVSAVQPSLAAGFPQRLMTLERGADTFHKGYSPSLICQKIENASTGRQGQEGPSTSTSTRPQTHGRSTATRSDCFWGCGIGRARGPGSGVPECGLFRRYASWVDGSGFECFSHRVTADFYSNPAHR